MHDPYERPEPLPKPVPDCGDYYPLWKHMSDNHGLTLLDSECEDILQAADKMKSLPLATITAERDAAITQAKHLSDWAAKMHDEMLHQSARANEWREEAIRLASALRIWSGIYHPGVPELVAHLRQPDHDSRKETK